MTDTTPDTTEQVFDASAERDAPDMDERTQDATPNDEDAPGRDDDTEEGEGKDEGRSKAAREAAKYRTRLRETETERDALRETVQRLQRAEVERLVTGRLSQPADVWDIGQANLTDLVDDDGHVVPELVETTVYGLLKERPGLAPPPKRQQHPSGIGLGNRGIPSPGTTWGDLLHG